MIDQYIHQYGKRLYGLCLTLCANTLEADDLYQDTWLQVVKNISRYDTNRELEPWLTKICVNLYRNTLRRLSKSPFLHFRNNEEKEFLLRQSGQCCGKVAVFQYGGLSAGGKEIFFVRLQPGKLGKLLLCQIVKGNFPLPFLLQPYDFPYRSTPNDSSTKGVMPASNILLIGFNLGHGNSPFWIIEWGGSTFAVAP